MRLATTASAILLALSTAALAQVATAPQQRTGNNATMGNATGPGNATMPAPTGNDTMSTAGNMMDNSAAPPPREPR